MTNPAQLHSINPYFIVDDVFASAEHYRDVFGFKFDQFWLEPPRFVIVMRDRIQIMLHQPVDAPDVACMRPNPQAIPHSYDAYVYTGDVDSLYTEFTSTGADLLGEPESMSHGCREFLVKDLNGYVLCFGEQTK